MSVKSIVKYKVIEIFFKNLLENKKEGLICFIFFPNVYNKVIPIIIITKHYFLSAVTFYNITKRILG